MKLIQIFGEELSLQIQMTAPTETSNPALSFGIQVKFNENGSNHEGKLVIHSKEVLDAESLDKYIDTFTATLITEETSRLCTGICYHDENINEIWLTIIEPEKNNLSSDQKCTCPTTCDCQNPPPEGWDGRSGVYHISESCPIHNDHPRPAPNCSVH